MKRYIKRVAILWSSTVVPLLLFYLLVALPAQAELDDLRQIAGEKESEYEELTQAASASRREEMEKEIAGLKERYEAFTAQAEEVSQIRSRIRQIAEELRLRSFASKVLFEGHNPAFAKFRYVEERNMSGSFEGDFVSFLAFVNRLERHEPAIFVDQFKLTRDMTHRTLVSGEIELAVLGEK